MAVSLRASSYQRIAAEVLSPSTVTFGLPAAGSAPRSPSWRPVIEVTMPSGYSPRVRWKSRTAPTDTAVHETWVLPPVLSVQYHPMPAARFSPYIGAGLNYMLFYSGEDLNGFKVDLEDGFGYSLQAGADIALTGPWSVNVDVKKVFFDTDARINNGALRSDVTLDPLVVSVGLGRKF